MAKKNSRTATAAAAVTAAIVPAIPAGQPLLAVNLPQPQMQLDLTIRTDDIVDIQVSEQRERLQLAAEAIEKDLDAAFKAHRKAEKRLTDLAEKLIDEQSADTATKELVARMDEFSGSKHGIKIVKVDAPDGRWHSGKKEDDTPEVNIAKLRIVGEIRITSKDKEVVLKRRFELEFSQAMKETVADIEQKSEAATKIEDRLRAVRKEMADVLNPNGYRMRTKSQLVKAYLTGSIRNTGDMLTTVMATPVKALPSSITTAKVTVVESDD